MIQLAPGEQLIATERRHWLPIAIQSISIALTALIPILFLVGAEFLPADALATVEEYRELTWFIYTVWLLGLWMVFAISITNYYLDVMFITNHRIIDIEQVGLFSRDTAELHLDSIEDIHVEVKGFIASFFKFGDLHIQTSSEHPQFSMNYVCDPHRVLEIISKARMAESGHAPSLPAQNS